VVVRLLALRAQIIFIKRAFLSILFNLTGKQEYTPLAGQMGEGYNASSIRLSTTVAEISRLAASGMTNDCGLSITSSVTIILRRTGRQCMKKALFVTAM